MTVKTWNITLANITTVQVDTYLGQLNQINPARYFVEFALMKRLHLPNTNLYSGYTLGECVVMAEQNPDSELWVVRELQ